MINTISITFRFWLSSEGATTELRREDTALFIVPLPFGHRVTVSFLCLTLTEFNTNSPRLTMSYLFLVLSFVSNSLLESYIVPKASHKTVTGPARFGKNTLFSKGSGIEPHCLSTLSGRT